MEFLIGHPLDSNYEQIYNGLYQNGLNLVQIEGGLQSKAMDQLGMRNLFLTLPEVTAQSLLTGLKFHSRLLIDWNFLRCTSRSTQDTDLHKIN